MTNCENDCINPSEFNRPWTLQKPGGTADDGGHVDLTLDSNWSSLGTHWLKFYKQSSREFYRAQQVQSNVTHVADVMYSQITKTINPSMRFISGTRKLEINAAFDPEESHKVIQMRLIERT